ncbi:MAG: dicarboxylate/amino acid:cation symporter [Caulobacteraceae bacterium]
MKTNTLLVLGALVAGVTAGEVLRSVGPADLKAGVDIVDGLGGLWLNALRMTVVPLVFALLVTGIASVADAASTGRLAARAVGLFLILLLVSAAFSVALSMGYFALWPVDPQGASALLAGAKAAHAAIPETPPFAEWLKGLAPANPLQAAANGDILQIVVFAVFLGFAITALSADLRDRLTGFFQAVAEAMIVIVRWVLWAAPAGVFALALGMGYRVGFDAAGALGQYIILACLAGIGITIIAGVLVAVFGRMSLGRFAAASGPPMAVAVSTQSSLATLPVIIETARDVLGISPRVTSLIPPLAVAVFRMTSPAVNLAVCFFVVAVYGVQPSAMQIVSAVLVALAISVGTVGLPGQLSFFANVAPICLALGGPIELLPILLAVEVIPDIFRTTGNVMADLAATVMLGREREPAAPQASPA